MSELRPPTRWLHDDAGAPGSFAEAARSFREDEPTAKTRERMWDTLEKNLAVQAVPRVWRMPWRGISALLVAGAGALLAVRGFELNARVPAIEDSVELVAPAQPAGVSESIAVDPLPSTEPAADGGAAVRPKVVASRALHRSKPNVKPQRTAAPAPVEQPVAADEVSMLLRARRLLHAQPERALALTTQHSEAHPRGVFAEERELLAIEALHQLGRHELQSQRITKFLAAYPASAHRRRIEALRGYE